jgi:hypothetical protein
MLVNPVSVVSSQQHGLGQEGTVRYRSVNEHRFELKANVG